MNLYLITQDLVEGYDTYDSAVVVAETEDDARKIHPSPFVTHVKDGRWMGTYSEGLNVSGEYVNDDGTDWVMYGDIEHIKVECLGETSKEKGMILASFNAG
jgi:hypothetical protein